MRENINLQNQENSELQEVCGKNMHKHRTVKQLENKNI